MALLLCNRHFLSIATKQVFCCVHYTFRVDCASDEDFFKRGQFPHLATQCKFERNISKEYFPLKHDQVSLVAFHSHKGWKNRFYVSGTNETEMGSLYGEFACPAHL